jgi:hypothetical protein
MFWFLFGVVISLGGLLGIPLWRNGIQSRVSRATDRSLDIIRTVLVCGGIMVSVASYLQSQHENETLQRQLAESREKQDELQREHYRIRNLGIRVTLFLRTESFTFGEGESYLLPIPTHLSEPSRKSAGFTLILSRPEKSSQASQPAENVPLVSQGFFGPSFVEKIGDRDILQSRQRKSTTRY